MVVHIFEVEGVDVAWEISKICFSARLFALGGGGATNPRMVNRILMRRSTLHPEMKRTPRGGTNNC